MKKISPAWAGGITLLCIAAVCLLSLPWTLHAYNAQDLGAVLAPPGEVPGVLGWMGTDALGRSMLVRCLLGGAISLSIGLMAAAITVVIGTTWGMISGYAGGRVDAFMMRVVDVLYGLPYILLVVLISVSATGLVQQYKQAANERLQSAAYAERRAAHKQAVERAAAARRALEVAASEADQEAAALALAEAEAAASATEYRPWLLRLIEHSPHWVNMAVLFMAIGLVSWLTLARVVRGQVLSLRSQPFVEAARACGCSPARVMFHHVLPNLIGPIIVYTTLTVPQAILQESFLSFLGIGVQAPLPSWGNLAAEGLAELNPVKGRPWLLAWPCVLLAMTLLALNFMGDGLRDRFDPRARHAA